MMNWSKKLIVYLKRRCRGRAAVVDRNMTSLLKRLLLPLLTPDSSGMAIEEGTWRRVQPYLLVVFLSPGSVSSDLFGMSTCSFVSTAVKHFNGM